MQLQRLFTQVRKRFQLEHVQLVKQEQDAFMISHPRKRIISYDDRQLKKQALGKEALIGVLAHELAHQADYARMSFLQRLVFMARYRSSHEFKRQAERRADKIAIAQGYGKALLALHHEFERASPGRYNTRIRPFHLGKDEISYLTKQAEKRKK